MLRLVCVFNLLWVFFCPPVLAETVDKIVANVNGEIILYSELKGRMRLLEKENPNLRADDPAKQKEIDREVLMLLVREKLTEQEVKRLKIVVSDRDLDSAVENVKREGHLTDAQFEYLLQQEGQTLAEFRESMRKRLERNRLLDRVLKSRTIITDDQVDAFLRTEDVSGRDLRRLAVLLIPIHENAPEKAGAAEKQARDLHARLKSGDDFAEVVRAHSKGPAVKEGGDIGFMESTELAKPIEMATRNLRVGEITEVIKSPGGFYIFKVLELQKERADTGDPETREKARRMLLQRELDRKFSDWIEDLERRAFIKTSL
ncbi:MAG: SurA N-terminal domain-containing protein [Syntrophobacteraceae bacterium]|jgi:peptidyl-prolyl cis-trans isomerase SurA|nr:SurA N-terminal domain-containing protein [Syntrophobacteraceae bacterium]